MKLFGHHVGRSFALFVGLDAVLFLVLIYVLGAQALCSDCLRLAPNGLEHYQPAALTAAFLLITTSVGLYNNDATQDFPTFARRFLLGSQLVLLPALAVVAIEARAAGADFAWQLGGAALTMAAFLLVSFLVRVGLVWGLGLSFLKKRVIVLGDGQLAEAVTAFVQGPGRSHYRHLQTLPSWRTVETTSTVGNLSLKELAREAVPFCALAESLRAQEIVVALEARDDAPFEELLECKLNGIAVVDALTFWEREAGQIDPTRAGADWLTLSGGFVINQRRRIFKRLTDILISLVFIAAVGPLAAFVALAVKLDSRGPAFYRQERVGLNGRVFKLWKFRSMRVDAERDGVPRWANNGDDRVTRVGRFIRKVRLDEIPQVINVLAGDMSFIGPRPERPFFVEQLKQQIPHYDLRHRVRPGITGWAQVNYPYGASIEDAQHKLAYDLYYLKKNDALLDFAILIQTVRVILFAHGGR